MTGNGNINIIIGQRMERNDIDIDIDIAVIGVSKVANWMIHGADSNDLVMTIRPRDPVVMTLLRKDPVVMTLLRRDPVVGTLLQRDLIEIEMTNPRSLVRRKIIDQKSPVKDKIPPNTDLDAKRTNVTAVTRRK